MWPQKPYDWLAVEIRGRSRAPHKAAMEPVVETLDSRDVDGLDVRRDPDPLVAAQEHVDDGDLRVRAVSVHLEILLLRPTNLLPRIQNLLVILGTEDVDDAPDVVEILMKPD